jgi:2-polyprenyl-3-methyl-5-hydroxy-6-metoxy-1,4-benzoquinol methylase
MAVNTWSDISQDPNQPEVLSYRIQELARARKRQLIGNRIAHIQGLVKGKDVLDIGVVEHFRASSAADTWLHQHVRAAARTCLGMDILADEVKSLCDRGYQVVTHDITSGPLDAQFDVIVVGDVIEHLNNPSALFKNAAPMLRAGGRLVVSTPNPWYANAILKNLFEGAPFTDSADHVTWFDAGTLCELANRFGLQLDSYAGVRAESSGTWRSRLLLKLTPVLVAAGLRPEVFAKTMLYEFTPKLHRA